LAFAPGGKILASGGKDRTLRLWDVQTQRPKRVLKTEEVPVLAVAFAPDGKTLALGSTDKQVQLWDTVQLLPRKSGALNQGNQ